MEWDTSDQTILSTQVTDTKVFDQDASGCSKHPNEKTEYPNISSPNEGSMSDTTDFASAHQKDHINAEYLTTQVNKFVMGQKRKNLAVLNDFPDIKKPSNNSQMANSCSTNNSNNTVGTDEKINSNLRKNIRDVLAETQLDSDTLVAQRQESERLARVAEQQKIIREYQRQTAVNRQMVRTQSKVLSLLQSGNSFGASVLENREDTIKKTDLSISNCQSNIDHLNNTLNSSPIECTTETKNDINEERDERKLQEVVTIEDSSSDDDCILLSDDEDELEEETDDDPQNSGLHVKDSYNVADELGRVIVNVGHPDGEEDIFMAPQIASTVKPHQIGGVRFLFDNIIESTKRFKSSTGFGCILAHSMGLGKTLQIVCFCDIFLRHTSSKTVLCVMPINTLQNWVAEFNKWAPLNSDDPEKVRPRQFDVFVLNDQQKTLSARAKVVLKWIESGGVLLIGYELFRLMALKLFPTRKRRNKNSQADQSHTESNKNVEALENIYKALVKPGPDLVICDEGHRIKNAQAGISLALKQIRTRRRIVLTGYPLQNNLLEYWCMVDFVRPNYLGTRTEFCNMFERPIQNGQCIDSTPEDRKLMRYRAHVLHSLLVGFVQRRSHLVLQQTLPEKLEYVILTRMTSFQRLLYQTFMNDVVRSKSVPNPLKAFAVCCKIWNHPDVLYKFLKKHESDLDLDIDDVSTDILSHGKGTTASKEKIFETPNIEVNKLICNSSASDVRMKPSISKNICDDEKLKESLSTENISKSFINNSSSGTMFYSSDDRRDPRLLQFTPYCGSSKLWSDNSEYFDYPMDSTNIGFPTEPDYVGLVDNKNYSQQDKESGSINSSSEIVDLDTKEIRTVKTEINLTINPIFKKDTCLDNQLNDSLNVAKTQSLSGSDEKEAEKEFPKTKSDDGIPYEWAIELMKKYKPGLIENSPKMEIFFGILNESITMGDRVLLFSQSLLTLNLIEQFLIFNKMPSSELFWSRNSTYFRLDGSTNSQEREKLVNEFNCNEKVKLFLISTRAGSLGINLVGANRVIVFDASWNPCHDTQAVYRVYRYGQLKKCYVYRIVMDKCLEKKIYDRQIKKQGMSDRVVDECNPDAHLSMKDITNLCQDYDDNDTMDYPTTFAQPIDSYVDTIIQKMVENYKNGLSKEPFYHESLLIDRKEKKLSQAEKRQAHRGYEIEKRANIKQNLTNSSSRIQYRIVRNDGTVITRPVASVRPMQAFKSQSSIKTNIRSTRWIPAEVWQRQGMTAQEMTLPLDVVIPTNSSDKSDIILKAGQRVMVLKSAKGIYMQLDSGKIIAIRTSSKANDTSKLNKEEVIDITSDGENTGKQCKKISNDGKPNLLSDVSKKQNTLDEKKKHLKSEKHDINDSISKSGDMKYNSPLLDSTNQNNCETNNFPKMNLKTKSSTPSLIQYNTNEPISKNSTNTFNIIQQNRNGVQDRTKALANHTTDSKTPYNINSYPDLNSSLSCINSESFRDNQTHSTSKYTPDQSEQSTTTTEYSQQTTEPAKNVYIPKYSMQHTQYNTDGSIINPGMNYISQYYDNIYDPTKYTPTEYATHTNPTFSSYNYNYRSYYPANVYDNMSVQSQSAYNMHWSPLLPPTTIAEHPNLYDTQHSQWYNK